MINKELKEYIELNIIPKYKDLDLAHTVEHVNNVIESSYIIAKDYDVNLEMVYVVAAFHDVGLVVDRKTHHIEGGKMLEKDSFIISYFNPYDIKIMKEAVEDHRASNSDKPRSIYGLIISEADLFDTANEIIKRSVLYRLNNNIQSSYKQIYDDVKFHIEDKYGYNGYLNSWLKSEHVEGMLKDLRNLLQDEERLKTLILDYYSQYQMIEHNKNSYNVIASKWDEFRKTTALHHYVKEFEKLLGANSYILDLGCGTGYPNINYLSSKNHKVHGIDISEEMLNYAINSSYIDTTYELTNFLDFNHDKLFDGVIAFDSLFHLPIDKHEEAFIKVSKLLKPGGYFFFTHGKRKSTVVGHMYDKEFLYSTLNSDEMIQILIDNGFEITESVLDYRDQYGHRELIVIARKI